MEPDITNHDNNNSNLKSIMCSLVEEYTITFEVFVKKKWKLD